VFGVVVVVVVMLLLAAVGCCCFDAMRNESEGIILGEVSSI
jgi:hypothetical protein